MSEIISSALYAFFIGLFGVIGLTVGVALSLILIATFFKRFKSVEKKTLYKPIALPNAQGKRAVLDKDSPVILQVDIKGVIGSKLLNMGSVESQLTESREGELKKNRVKAVLLKINSPGGTVIDSDSIYRQLKEYKKRYNVPIYAYVDGLCASGGMYIASAADKIYCSNTSLIGSIGVVSFPFFNVSKTLDDWGIESLTLSEGKGKDHLNPFRPWKPGEDKNHREILGDYYKNFVKIIVENRPINEETLIETHGAKIFSAGQAQEIGLVDKKGFTLSETIEEMVDVLKIEDEEYQVVELVSKKWYPNFLQGPLEIIGEVNQNWRMAGMTFCEKSPFMYLYIP